MPGLAVPEVAIDYRQDRWLDGFCFTLLTDREVHRSVRQRGETAVDWGWDNRDGPIASDGRGPICKRADGGTLVPSRRSRLFLSYRKHV